MQPIVAILLLSVSLAQGQPAQFIMDLVMPEVAGFTNAVDWSSVAWLCTVLCMLFYFAHGPSFVGFEHASDKRGEEPHSNSHGVAQSRQRAAFAGGPARCKAQVGLPSAVARRKVKPMAIKAQENETWLKEFLIERASGGDDNALAVALADMEMRFGTFTMSDFVIIIKHFARQADARAAHKWLRRAIEVGHVPSPVMFHTVITSYVQQADLEQAVQVAMAMQRLRVEFNTTTYNIMIDAFARADDAVNAQLWLKKLLAAQLHATAASFGPVLVSCATAGLHSNLDEWFAVSQKIGVRMNQRWFSSVVSALAKRNELVLATTWVGRMVQHGIRPRADCISALLGPILGQGKVDLAKVLIERMREAGIEPDAQCLNRCIAVAALMGHNTLAQQWAEECVASTGSLQWGARRALIHGGMQVPASPHTEESSRSHPSPEDAAAEGQVLDAERVGRPSTELQIAQVVQRRACVGKTFVGIIKDFKQARFGFIACEDTYQFFQRDVYIGGGDNPESLDKGQRVSFTLKLDPNVGLPRAYDMKVCTELGVVE